MKLSYEPEKITAGKILETPAGMDRLLLTSNGKSLMGVRFIPEGCVPQLPAGTEVEDDVIAETVAWLEAYFQGRPPIKLPPLAFFPEEGGRLTAFQRQVLTLMREIPFGKTVTYGHLASCLPAGIGSPRAVGGAVGKNPWVILLPCHRVLAAGGTGGYSCGKKNKLALLRHEGILPEEFLME